MANTTLLSSLMNNPPVEAKARTGGARQAGDDPFSSIFASTRSEAPRRETPAREGRSADTPSHKTEQDHSARSEPAGSERSERAQGPQSDGLEAERKAEAGNTSQPTENKQSGTSVDEPREALTEEQKATLEALPEEQQQALEALGGERLAKLLDMMMAQRDALNQIAPDIAAKLSELSEAEIEQLQGVLNKLAQMAETQALAAEDVAGLIDEQIGDPQLAEMVKQALLTGVAKADAQATGTKLTDNLAGMQLALANAGSGKGYAVSSELLSGSVFKGTKLDLADWGAAFKEQTTALNSAAKGPMNESAQLHNLLAPKVTLEEPKMSPSGFASMVEAAQRANVRSETPPVLQSQLGTKFGSGGWNDAVGQKVMWMAKQNIGAAELRLDPPDLGPLQVRVNVHNDQTHITFTSHQSVVRDALDQSAFRLREMLAEQGMTQVNVDVSGRDDGRPSDQELVGEPQSDGEEVAGGVTGEGDQSGVGLENGGVVHLVDHYA
ncbi:flagellar hook-length control protein FliK [Gilvimarinus xylanilyticus]|uniref:Flagellar hook-length control protein FliK n=1 Tax=Gilvimarinus xylanilyticus TaxID=2944139 RepID=A0A9X2I0G3_9GAMM|nr:flagellar hook-length control protein FliK [Gilvimarinus xylanilyticus]MCP8898328.1 flagellar hook-length control protein FliK [Gilvimarinus xylanilyticus]